MEGWGRYFFLSVGACITLYEKGGWRPEHCDLCVCGGGGGKVDEVAECLVTWGGGGGFNLNQQMIFVYVFTLPKHYHSVP